MSEKTTHRRTVLRGLGTAAALGGLGVVGSATAATTYRQVEVDGGANDGTHEVDYTLRVNSSDVSALGDTESNDNVYNYSNSTSIYGHLKGNGGVDTYEIPHDAALTYVYVSGDKDGSHVQLIIEPRGYGYQRMAFRGVTNPGWSKIEYSATSGNEGGSFSKYDSVEGYPEDTTTCGYGVCSLVGKVKADHEDVWELNGGSPASMALNTMQQGGSAEIDIDVITP